MTVSAASRLTWAAARTPRRKPATWNYFDRSRARHGWRKKNLTRVVVVDDSRMMRELISQALIADGDIAIAGSAVDPLEARALIRATHPDVVTLDVEMPRMHGLDFLKQTMALRPMPVVMVSGTTTKGAETTLTALEIGAVDFVTKPGSREEWTGFAGLLREKVRTATRVKFNRGAVVRPAQPGTPLAAGDLGRAARSAPRSRAWPHCSLIAVGASTGGVTSINRLLAGLPAIIPPLVIAQHMPPGFTTRCAERLARTTGRDVTEATEGEVLRQGTIRLAPGDRHLCVSRSGGKLICRVNDDPPVGNHRPSVHALFASVAEVCGNLAVGVILTGMGSDGAKGLLQMRTAGARTFGEAESSCTVYGMPRVAMKIGAVTDEHQIDALTSHLSRHIDTVNGFAKTRR